jgi:hypothetical protein
MLTLFSLFRPSFYSLGLVLITLNLLTYIFAKFVKCLLHGRQASHRSQSFILLFF